MMLASMAEREQYRGSLAAKVLLFIDIVCKSSNCYILNYNISLAIHDLFHIVSRNSRNEFFNSLYDFSKSLKEFFAKAMQNKCKTISFSFFR